MTLPPNLAPFENLVLVCQVQVVQKKPGGEPALGVQKHGIGMFYRNDRAVLMAPPFAVPTWLRPIVSTQSADANKIAGGWIYATEFDVITLDKGSLSSNPFIQRRHYKKC